jgi:hypothetical protein
MAVESKSKKNQMPVEGGHQRYARDAGSGSSKRGSSAEYSVKRTAITKWANYLKEKRP